MSKIEEIRNEIEAINEEFGLVEENGKVTTTSLIGGLWRWNIWKNYLK